MSSRFDYKPYDDEDSDVICGKCGGLGYVQITGDLILQTIFDMSTECTACKGEGIIKESDA